MRELMLIALMWIHLTATVLWLGGITFILLVAIPSTRQVLQGEAGKVMGEVTRRFTPLANFSIFFLFLSGIFYMAIDSNGEMIKGERGTAMLLKLLLFLLMFGVHFFRGKVLAPRIAKTQSVEEKANLQKLSLNLVWLNFGSGLAVLLLSVFAGAW